MNNENLQDYETFQLILNSFELTPEEWLSKPNEDVKSAIATDVPGFQNNVQTAHTKFKSFLTTKRLDAAKLKRERLTISSLTPKYTNIVEFPTAKESLAHYIAELKPEKRQLLAANFRNFQNLSELDCKALLEEIIILEGMNATDETQS